uniref:Uncharacterized protein n=1 Tax=Anguilla anguilla TaxID=7936 RepID=A0A0E9PQH4_ANGAN
MFLTKEVLGCVLLTHPEPGPPVPCDRASAWPVKRFQLT